MFALRIAYQRHRRLVPAVVAGVVLFFATLLVTMPTPGMAVTQTQPVPVVRSVSISKAGALGPLLASHPMEEQVGLSFAPAQGPL